MQSNLRKSLFFAAALVLLPFMVQAAATPPQSESNSYNVALICWISLILVLLFVIGGLGYILRWLSYDLQNKMRKEKQDAKSGIVKTVLLLAALSIPAIHSFAADQPAAATPVATKMIQGLPEFDFYLIITIVSLELFVILIMTAFIQMMLHTMKIQNDTKILNAPALPQRSWFWDNFNKAVSLEKEHDILLDHNYDGIQELDNSLPPWWKYGFYLTIIVGIIYFYRYEVSHTGLSQVEEYNIEMTKAETDKAAYLAKSNNNIDENNVTLLKEPADLNAGKELFLKTCSPCHLQDGGGIVGPNLTDDYWLHGGSIKDIFKTIKYGWQDKGMKSWKDDFSPKQIQQLASYIKSLRGTHPATPKAPQGDLYIEAGAPKVDSASTPKVDTTVKVK